MSEVFLDITGYEGLYQISNKGRVKSLERKVTNPCCGGLQTIKEKILCTGGSNYPKLKLRKNNKYKTYNVHRLVATAFIPNPQNKYCINHKDGIRTNNSVENLEWCSYKENTKHAFVTGLTTTKRGEKSHMSKLTDKQVKDLRQIKKHSNLSDREIGEIYGLCRVYTNKILNNKRRMI